MTDAALPTPEQLTLQHRGLRLAAQRFVQRAADVTTPPRRLLALHGWLDNSNSFARLAPLLQNVEIVAVDMPGHGRSSHRSSDAQYHFIDWVDDVLGIAEQLQWDRLTLLGHSMGAGIAVLVAGAFPALVEGLLLLDGLGPLSAAAEDTAARLQEHHPIEVRLRRRRTPVYPQRAALAALMCQVVPHLSLPNALLLLERGACEVAGGVQQSHDPRLRARSLFRMSEAQIGSFLRRICCPTLLLRPSQGYPFAASMFEQRTALIQNLQVISLAGGHHVHLEQAAVVAPLLQQFLDALG